MKYCGIFYCQGYVRYNTSKSCGCDIWRNIGEIGKICAGKSPFKITIAKTLA